MSRPSCAGVILAGGQSKRMGGENKCLLNLSGKPLIEHVIEKLLPQVDSLSICTGPQQGNYSYENITQIADIFSGYDGPLAGIHAAMHECKTDYLFVVPCDNPFIPENLVEQMFQQINSIHSDVCILNNGVQDYPLPCLLSCKRMDQLEEYLNQGRRKLITWLTSCSPSRLCLPESDKVFFNINTKQDLLDAGTV